MKKLIIVYLYLFAFGNITVNAEKMELCLKIERKDKSYVKDSNHKAPIRMPVIYQNDHILSFRFQHLEYILNIVQDDEVVFSAVVPADVTQYELPYYISGECTIQFIIGDYCFWTEIEF